ncbi:MAG: nicotinate-nucleotide adenylyltransferase [Bryobacterales bacterium]|nr:nicotinate-nucleotide adenylyltransferase [Bryobacterales bacterium]
MRLGLFGGTFDPIHNAHLAVAREAADALKLQQVWFIPNAVPPHKEAGKQASWEDRFRMVELACEADPRFAASRLERENRKSYTFHTLETVRNERGAGDEIFFLIGADAFAEIGIWYRKEDVFTMVEFIVVSRPGHQYAVPPGARVHRLESLRMDVSSSEIRQRLEAGDSTVPVPPAVLRYIEQNAIYRPPARTAGTGLGAN